MHTKLKQKPQPSPLQIQVLHDLHNTNNQKRNKRVKYLLPYSGATKCMFLMFSWQVLTCWWIESGATREKESACWRLMFLAIRSQADGVNGC